ncbi:hypothetical protein F5Y18DRAFT_344958 [Xylariaceae sp. FL1019]|nr:hypothetical protein F5Y18DRAFT_344958 [Xylariaceae sp. FL1019]
MLEGMEWLARKKREVGSKTATKTQMKLPDLQWHVPDYDLVEREKALVLLGRESKCWFVYNVWHMGPTVWIGKMRLSAVNDTNSHRSEGISHENGSASLWEFVVCWTSLTAYGLVPQNEPPRYANMGDAAWRLSPLHATWCHSENFQCMRAASLSGPRNVHFARLLGPRLSASHFFTIGPDYSILSDGLQSPAVTEPMRPHRVRGVYWRRSVGRVRSLLDSMAINYKGFTPL